MQVVITLLHLYCMPGDFHMSTDILVQNFTSFLISTLVLLTLNFLMKSHLPKLLKMPNNHYHCS